MGGSRNSNNGSNGTSIEVYHAIKFIFHQTILPIITSWSLLGPGVEMGLTPNFMKCIHIFPLSNCWVIFFFFLPSKLDVQCMVITKKEQNKILFQNPFKLMFNKYNKQCKVGEGHLNSYFYKKSKFYKCVMILKVLCVLVGFGNTKI